MRRPQAQDGVHADLLATCREVAHRSERLRAGEQPLLGPPEGDLEPDAAADERHERERKARRWDERDDVVRNAETGGDHGAVARVPVEELHDTGGLAERRNPFLEPVERDRIDEPDPPLARERVTRPAERVPPRPRMLRARGPAIAARIHDRKEHADRSLVGRETSR